MATTATAAVTGSSAPEADRASPFVVADQTTQNRSFSEGESEGDGAERHYKREELYTANAKALYHDLQEQMPAPPLDAIKATTGLSPSVAAAVVVVASASQQHDSDDDDDDDDDESGAKASSFLMPPTNVTDATTTVGTYESSSFHNISTIENGSYISSHLFLNKK